MAGTAVLSLFTGRQRKEQRKAAKGEGGVCQWIEVNIQRKLGLPPCFVGLIRVSGFLFCYLKTESDWKKPGNTCTPALTQSRFEPLFSQSTPMRSSDVIIKKFSADPFFLGCI